MDARYVLLAAAILFILPATVSSAPEDTIQSAITTPVCSILLQIIETLRVLIPSLIVIMLFYGATKYAMGGNDPGSRKQGKTIIIHALLAFVVWETVKIIFGLLKNMGLGFIFTATKCVSGM